MSLAAAVTNQLARKGRPMTLRRRVGTSSTFTEATVQGFMVAFSPSELIGLIQQGDARVTIGPDAGVLTQPAVNDFLHIDGAAWRVMGAPPLCIGPTVVGYRLWVRGGAR